MTVLTSAALLEALTPSAHTKAAYIGEFKFSIELSHPRLGYESRSVTVPWSTTKEIMAAIRKRAESSSAGIERLSPEVTVKPLEWRVPEDGELGHDQSLLTALGIGGSYDIAQQTSGYILWWAADPFTFRENFETIESAKAAAEADWQLSVRRALEAP